MKLYCVVFAGLVSCGWSAATLADCPEGGTLDANCPTAPSVSLVPGPALDDTLHGVSFSTASAASYERRVLQGREQLVTLPSRGLLTEAGTLPDAQSAAAQADAQSAAVQVPVVYSLDAVRSAEMVAVARGGQVTASAVPEPDSLLMVLAGLAAIFVLFSRQARRDR
jgi:hypothetical protein